MNLSRYCLNGARPVGEIAFPEQFLGWRGQDLLDGRKIVLGDAVNIGDRIAEASAKLANASGNSWHVRRRRNRESQNRFQRILTEDPQSSELLGRLGRPRVSCTDSRPDLARWQIQTEIMNEKFCRCLGRQCWLHARQQLSVDYLELPDSSPGYTLPALFANWPPPKRLPTAKRLS